jgi:hypothetical protein
MADASNAALHLTFSIHTQPSYSIMASDHNVWCRFLIFQAVEMLTLVAYILTSQCSVFTLGTDRVLTHLKTAYSHENLRNQFAPARDDIPTIRLWKIVWDIHSDQDGVVDFKRAITGSWAASG